ncbi:aminopyrimidine aminohydrolase [Thalassobacillus devorans]|uniref:Aminopyrimidine aminohydrolase n=1 Tax=Thalassobacillus devorans TaxID=279813 RepID=A0ABQ1NL58_9BACI|nr:thiaminase II [Thalassobacillus devorans]NIK27334.1 thiaminase/transcriptional activator TenA [Thalassobacillus devorans]GGC76900.1 aminopyrimidine aminohydrolase [Thalassobacillus devorans]
MFTDRLYNHAKPIWDAYLEHPFVKGIGDGSLDLEKFKFFMEQDYLYLIDYCRVFALGSVKATHLDTMTMFADLLHSTLNEEMELHRNYAERLGIRREELENTKPSSTLLAYTSYMLNKAHQGAEAEVAACVLACTWSYNVIGLALNEKEGASDHEFYGDWIKMYASDEFTELAEAMKKLMNELADGKPEREKAHLEEIFLHTSKLEYLFWDMSYHKKMWLENSDLLNS